MKIILIGKFYSPYKGGIESVVQNLAEGLVGKGHEVRCLVSNTKFKKEKEIINGVEVIRLPTLFKLLSLPITIWQSRYIEEYSPGIVHVHAPNPLALLWLSTLKLNPHIKKIATIHSLSISSGAFNSLHRKFSLMIFKSYNYLVFTSNSLLQNFLDEMKYRKSEEKVYKVIPLGIAPIVNGNKNKLSDKIEKKKIIFIGRLVKYKGVEYLLKAIIGTGYRLTIIGVGPENSKLEKIVKKLKLSDQVEFKGEVSEERKKQILEISDLLILPSISQEEAFGVSLLEGMSMGLPLISTKLNTGTSEINKDNITGVVVSPKDSKELKEAISSILSSEDKYRVYSKNCIERFNQLYTKEEMVLKHEQLYLEALQD